MSGQPFPGPIIAYDDPELILSKEEDPDNDSWSLQNDLSSQSLLIQSPSGATKPQAVIDKSGKLKADSFTGNGDNLTVTSSIGGDGTLKTALNGLKTDVDGKVSANSPKITGTLTVSGSGNEITGLTGDGLFSVKHSGESKFVVGNDDIVKLNHLNIGNLTEKIPLDKPRLDINGISNITGALSVKQPNEGADFLTLQDFKGDQIVKIGDSKINGANIIIKGDRLDYDTLCVQDSDKKNLFHINNTAVFASTLGIGSFATSPDNGTLHVKGSAIIEGGIGTGSEAVKWEVFSDKIKNNSLGTLQKELPNSHIDKIISVKGMVFQVKQNGKLFLSQPFYIPTETNKAFCYVSSICRNTNNIGYSGTLRQASNEAIMLGDGASAVDDIYTGLQITVYPSGSDPETRFVESYFGQSKSVRIIPDLINLPDPNSRCVITANPNININLCYGPNLKDAIVKIYVSYSV